MINVFCVRSPTYLKHRHEPLAQRVASLSQPAVRAAILDEYDQTGGSAAAAAGLLGDPLTLRVSESFGNMWIMDAHSPDYEPHPDQSIESLAAARGLRPQELLLDALLADGGRGVVWYPYAHGYSERNYDNVLLGMEHPLCILGNADAGAHVAAFTDASCTTFMLSFWAEEGSRTRGPKLPLEKLVQANAHDPARLYGWTDRGTIEVSETFSWHFCCHSAKH